MYRFCSFLPHLENRCLVPTFMAIAFSKQLRNFFLTPKTWKKLPSKVAHNQPTPFYFTVHPRPQLTTQNYFFILKNLGTRHLFSYLCFLPTWSRTTKAWWLKFFFFATQIHITIRDIHIECSKQFKWNSYFYMSGQSRLFWAALKLL